MQYTGWNRDYSDNRRSYQRIFDGVMSSKDNNVEFLERQVLEFITKRDYAVAVASATDALHFSLLCHNVGAGDEVLVTDFSWISTSSCISMVGATPVFCDIDLESYHISLESIKRMVSPKTKALIYTHLFGNMTDSTAIQEFCQENNIIFIEDSAQSLGSSLNGIRAGSIGDCSSFSFNINKVIAGPEGGGMFLTNNEEHAEFVWSIRRHGKKNDFTMLGRNSTMGLLNAKIISNRLKRLTELHEKREIVAQKYNQAFNGLPIFISPRDDNLIHNNHKYVIRLEDNDLREHLRQHGFQVHYDNPLSENSMYDNIKHRKDDCVNSKIASNTVMSLPIHSWMEQSEINNVIEILWRIV